MGSVDSYTDVFLPDPQRVYYEAGVLKSKIVALRLSEYPTGANTRNTLLKETREEVFPTERYGRRIQPPGSRSSVRDRC